MAGSQVSLYFVNDPSVCPEVTKVYEKEHGRIIIKRIVNNSTVVTDFDFRNTPEGYFTTPNGYQDTVYTINIDDADNIQLSIGAYVRGSILPSNIEEASYYDGSYPRYIYVGVGETATEESNIGSAPSWIVTSLTYLEKQERAIRAVKAWRDQKRHWMLQAAERADLADNLVSKVGKWLKSADAAIQIAFQDVNTDPLDVAKIATLAAQGSLDVTDVDAFMRGVHYYSATPSTPQLWVTKTNPARVNLSQIVEYGTDSVGAYDPVDTSWIIANQAGSVTLSDTTPSRSSVVTATLTDPDGGVTGTEWQWQSRTGDTGTWADISNATSASYTPVAADVGKQLRAVAKYNDNANSDTTDKNTASSDASSAVT